MSIETRTAKDGKIIVKTHSNLDNRETADEFRRTIEEVYDDGAAEIVLDLTGIDMINSYGIGKILMFYKRLKESGGQLYLLAPLPPMIKEILDTLMLTNLLKEYKE